MKRETDDTSYTVEIECMNDSEIKDLLQQSILDYRKYHIRNLSEDRALPNGELEHLRTKAELAWHTLAGVFPHHPGCTEAEFRKRDVETNILCQTVLGWQSVIMWPARLNTSTRTMTLKADSIKTCVDRMEESMAVLKWPFVKVVR